MRLSAEDRKTLMRWVERAVADLERRHDPPRPRPPFEPLDWGPLLRDALGSYAEREPLRFLSAVIGAIPSGQAVDLGPLSSDLCDALIAHLRTTCHGDAAGAVAAAERLLRHGHNRTADAEPGAL